jgi:sugar phosphate permease
LTDIQKLFLKEEMLLPKKNIVHGMFFGWWIVWATGILSFWGQSFCNFGFAALFKPIATELSFSRTATSVAASVTRLEGGFFSPVVGWITDRFGPRWIIFSGIFIIGLSLNLMFFVNSLWQFYLIWGLLMGIGTTMGLGLAQDKTITNWFVKKRGRALTIRWVLFALAAVLGVPLVGWLISIMGWRMTCVVAGGIVWITGLPLAWFFIKQHRPEFYGLFPDGVPTEKNIETPQLIDKGVKYAIEVDEVEFTLRQAMRTPAFWLLVLSIAGFQMVAPLIIIHGVPLLTDMGVNSLKATVLVGVMGISAIPGTLLGGFVADHIGKRQLRYVLAGGYALELIAFILFLKNPTLIMVYPIFAVHHFTGGIFGLLGAMMTARYFGRKAFGSIRGTAMMFGLPATISAPIFAGWVYDTTGSYATIFKFCTFYLAFSIIFILLAIPPKAPAKVTGIHHIL